MSNTKHLEDLASDVYLIFLATEATLQRMCPEDFKCVTLGKFIPAVNDELGIGRTDATFDEGQVRAYIAKHPEFKIDRGKYGGVRRLRPGEAKSKAEAIVLPVAALVVAEPAASPAPAPAAEPEVSAMPEPEPAVEAGAAESVGDA